MAQHMRRNLLGKSCTLAVGNDDFIEALARHRSAPACHEKRLARVRLAMQKLWPHHADIMLQITQRRASQGQHALLRALAHDNDVFHLQIHIFQRHINKLRHAHPRRIQNLQHRLIAIAVRRAKIRRIQQRINLRHAQHLGQMQAAVRRLQHLCRIAADIALRRQKAVERFDRGQLTRHSRSTAPRLPQLHKISQQLLTVHPEQLLARLEIKGLLQQTQITQIGQTRVLRKAQLHRQIFFK